MRRQHGQEFYTCRICQKTFPTKSCLNTHRDTEHEKLIKRCSVCDKTFLSLISFQRHVKRQNCASTKVNKTPTQDRFVTEVDETNVPITDSIENSSELEMDSSEDNPKDIFKCQLCTESFAKKNSLNVHLLVKHLNKKFECDFCEKDDFQDFNCLKQHLKFKHGKKMTPQCHICDKTFGKNI